VGVLDGEGEGEAADGGARGDRDGRADCADRVLLEVEHGHGGRLGVETGQQEPLAGDGPRGEAGHLVPGEVVAAARKVSADVLAELAGRSEMARKVHDSYAAFRDRTAPWSRISIKAVLDAREG